MRRLSALLLAAVFALCAPVWAQGKPEEEEGSPSMSEEYRRRYTLDPENQDPRQVEFSRLYRSGHYEPAMAILREWISEDERDVGAMVTLANMYWDKAEFAMAEEWYKRTLKTLPRHVEARKWLGRMYLHRGRFKEAEAQFQVLVDRKKLRPDIKSSAEINMGKIALVKREFNDADKYFFMAGRSPRKGHRNMAEKGRAMTMRFRKTMLWELNKVETENLRCYFSPEIHQAREAGARVAWANRRQAAFTRMCRELGVTFPEPWPLYVFADEADAARITAKKMPSWKYSWWIVATAWERDPGFDLALQLAARVAGARPGSIPMVAGLACHLDDDRSDPHAGARRRLKEGALLTFVDGHRNQRYEIEEGRVYGESFVSWLIATYGMERFLDSYRHYNVVLLNPDWRSKATGRFRWEDALSAVFQRGIGEDYPTLERKWKAFLAGG